MSPSCAKGSGELPPYVDRLDWRPPGGTVRVLGTSRTQDTVAFATDEALQLHCRQLAQERCLFRDSTELVEAKRQKCVQLTTSARRHFQR